MRRIFSILLTARKGRALLTLAVLVALGFWGYHQARDAHVVDGERVQRRITWYGRGLGNPIPAGLAEVYYSYLNGKGKEVRHGQSRKYHVNGALSFVGTYRHGKIHGNWSTWNERGQKTGDYLSK
jgi:hypothetical protein